MTVRQRKKLLVVLIAQQRQQLQRAHLVIVQAILCAVQVEMLLSNPYPFLNEPRAYPTRVPRFDFATLSDDDCRLRFRFEYHEIERIAAAMDLPVVIIVNRITVTRATGLAMLLRKLVWPDRLVSLTAEFGLDYSSCSRIITYMATTVMRLYNNHLQLWPGLTSARIAQCAAAITAFTPGVVDIWQCCDVTCFRAA